MYITLLFCMICIVYGSFVSHNMNFNGAFRFLGNKLEIRRMLTISFQSCAFIWKAEKSCNLCMSLYWEFVLLIMKPICRRYCGLCQTIWKQQSRMMVWISMCAICWSKESELWWKNKMFQQALPSGVIKQPAMKNSPVRLMGACLKSRTTIGKNKNQLNVH